MQKSNNHDHDQAQSPTPGIIYPFPGPQFVIVHPIDGQYPASEFPRDQGIKPTSSQALVPKLPPPTSSASLQQPNLRDYPDSLKVYTAIYAGVVVYEVNHQGMSVMRRSGDSFVNATHILIVAGLSKSERT
ncbi:transcriptional regulator swi6 [Nowakowskiella sp. JEL0407]|nr:transcriptional regulator swi6 [Nowakowskiella sp. JEL0407]